MKHLITKTVYHFNRMEEGEYETCDCCSYPAPLHRFPGSGPWRQQLFALCCLCSYSDLGGRLTAAGYIDRAIAAPMFAANTLLDQMGVFDASEVVETP